MLHLVALLPFLAGLAVAHPTAIHKRDTDVLIKAQRDGLCLSVSGNQHATFTNGAGIFSVPCADATSWDISRGSGSILAHNVNSFALDAGSNPGNNGGLHLWQSYPGLYQQTWYYTDDNRIAITGGNQCLDEGDNGIQTYQCTPGNTNQIFTIVTRGQVSSSAGPSSTSSAAPSSTSSAPPTSSSVPPPTASGYKILSSTRPQGFLTVQNGFAGIGTAVQFDGNFGPVSEYGNVQNFNVPAAGTAGAIQLVGTNLCLDAGDSPANGSGLKVYTCYAGLLQQTWTNNGDGTFSLANGQCLDDVAGSGPSGYSKPYNPTGNVQTWQCSTNGDPQQKFVLQPAGQTN